MTVVSYVLMGIGLLNIWCGWVNWKTAKRLRILQEEVWGEYDLSDIRDSTDS